MYMSLLYKLIDAFENDINQSNASGLRILHKLTADHLFLNPYLRMRIYLAAQVFSNRVAQAITIQGYVHNLNIRACIAMQVTDDCCGLKVKE
ncbi:hypothetical protein QZH41_002450 [Actinostola sp. cb2023]|nr:hypothetical protein QZH41_002450 [Actinostola sp. cb2023]